MNRPIQKYSALLIMAAVFIVAADIPAAEKKEYKMADKKQDIQNTETATFAGGCFWCMEPPFEKLKGVVSVTSGYAGGAEENPAYGEVASGRTGHVEAVQIVYDPQIISYSELLNIYWRQIDPTDTGGSFVDRGNHYKSVIFYHDEDQKALAEDSKRVLSESGTFNRPIATEIKPFTTFYRAEDYHQDYCEKNPLHYKLYRRNSGRDQFIEKHWKDAGMQNFCGQKRAGKQEFKKPDSSELKARLSDLQYRVTQENATERPFENKYWDNKEPGIYVDIVSGEPLFASLDKFDSGTGWPSFTRPIDKDAVVERTDKSLFMARTEVRSRIANSHLGHVFSDGPPPTGRRYCINSAALRFVHAKNLEKQGYEEYKNLFDKEG